VVRRGDTVEKITTADMLPFVEASGSGLLAE
jgi:hypothetical protein